MSKKLLTLALMFVLIFCSLSLFSQKMLLIRKYGDKHNAKYYVGSTIDFSYYDRAGDVSRVSGVINIINDETIIVNYDGEYELSKIKTVYVKRHMLSTAQTMTAIASGGYLLLTGFNNIISKNDNHLSSSEYIVAGSLIGVVVATWPFRTKRFHLENHDKYVWEVLNF